METKIKAKPNHPIGFINYTQEHEKGQAEQWDTPYCSERTIRVSRVFREDKGITLIALLIMVILVVILAAISIKGLTGKEGIFASSSKIGNEYVIAQYGEQVEQLANSIILKDSLARKNHNNRKYGRGNGKRRLDKECSAKRQIYNSHNNRWVHI